MKLSIVILNWNGASHLQKFLPVLLRHVRLGDDLEVVVADNGSTDDSRIILAKNFPQVKTIEFDRNYGFAEGYNKALSEINSEYFLLLNSDVEVSEGWLQPLLSYMDEHEQAAACQPKIRSFQKKDYFEYAGAAGGFIDSLGYPFCRGRVLGKLEKDNGQYDDTVNIFWATGACLLIRSEIFWKTGGLDASFFAHMEEIDLCWRLRSCGYDVVCVPQSVVYHVGGGTLTSESPYKTYLNYRNNLLMLYKNLPDKTLRKVMFARYFFDYLSVFHMLLTCRFSNALQVFKARHDYKKLRPAYALKRAENLRRSVISLIPEILPRNIILQYYFCGNVTYRKLTGR